MTLAEKLDAFMGAVGRAAAVAPDEYPPWSYDSFEKTKADIVELWPLIKTEMKLNSVQVAFVESKLAEAFSAFSLGEKVQGRQAMWAIYNSRLGERLD